MQPKFNAKAPRGKGARGEGHLQNEAGDTGNNRMAGATSRVKSLTIVIEGMKNNQTPALKSRNAGV
jgi:hypothetical protein